MKISFIIPLHNEEKNAPILMRNLLTLIKQENWDAEIIPVNDRSSDKTGQILDQFAAQYNFVKPIHRMVSSFEKGNTMGEALKEGTVKASGNYVIWTMGDRADDLATYTLIINKLETGFDVIFASRYMQGGSRGNLDSLKAFLSQRGTILARLLFGVPVHDITNAFRGFRKNIFSRLRLQSCGFAISPEFAVKAHLAGYKLGEVPTVYHDRAVGVSNFKLLKMSIEYIKICLKLFFQYKFKSLLNKENVKNFS